MRELDVLLMRFLETEMTGASPLELAKFGQLLSLQDPEIHALLTRRSKAQDDQLDLLVQRILNSVHGKAGPRS